MFNQWDNDEKNNIAVQNILNNNLIFPYSCIQ